MENKKENRIKAIIFDIGGVLAIENRTKQYGDLARIMDFDIDKFQELRKKKVELFVRGKVSEKEYLTFFAKKFNLNMVKLRKHWVRLAKENYKLDLGVSNIIRKLKKNYFLITLTNIIPLHNKIRKTNNPYKDFNLNLLSFKQGYAKPDLAFYKLLFKKTKFKPQEMIFIDDHKPYLDPAKKLGLKVIHFKNSVQLKQDLKKMGVKL